jgi:hypothetical protein
MVPAPEMGMVRVQVWASPMRTVSASGIFLFKRIIPAIFFGFQGLCLISVVVTGAVVQTPQVLVAFVLCGGFTYLLLKLTVFNLADEVLDAGDHLVMRRGGREILIPLSMIIGVSENMAHNPPKVTLTLASPSEFGSTVAFMVQRESWNPFRMTCAIADELKRRCKAAREDLTAV